MSRPSPDHVPIRFRFRALCQEAYYPNTLCRCCAKCSSQRRQFQDPELSRTLCASHVARFRTKGVLISTSCGQIATCLRLRLCLRLYLRFHPHLCRRCGCFCCGCFCCGGEAIGCCCCGAEAIGEASVFALFARQRSCCALNDDLDRAYVYCAVVYCAVVCCAVVSSPVVPCTGGSSAVVYCAVVRCTVSGLVSAQVYPVNCATLASLNVVLVTTASLVPCASFCAFAIFESNTILSLGTSVIAVRERRSGGR